VRSAHPPRLSWSSIFYQERIGKGGRRFRIFKFRTMQHNLDDSFHRAFMKAFVNGELEDELTVPSTNESTISLNTDHYENLDHLKHAFRKIFLVASSQKTETEEKVYKPFTSSQVTRVGRILRKTSLDELPQILNVLKGEMSWVGPRPNVPYEVEAYKPWHHERLEVLPGITGLAQAKGRSSITFDHIAQYDIEYVQKQNLGLDLKVLWLTVFSVIRGSGAD
jgi:lipopolysaccharide/colanic/teichoic acid biosynthesis glycosyltransferase